MVYLARRGFVVFPSAELFQTNGKSNISPHTLSLHYIHSWPIYAVSCPSNTTIYFDVGAVYSFQHFPLIGLRYHDSLSMKNRSILYYQVLSDIVVLSYFIACDFMPSFWPSCHNGCRLASCCIVESFAVACLISCNLC